MIDVGSVYGIEVGWSSFRFVIGLEVRKRGGEVKGAVSFLRSQVGGIEGVHLTGLRKVWF